MSFKQKYVIGSLALSISAISGAQEAMEPVVITATRFEQPITRTIAPVTVITREDIERKQYSSVEDALQTVPGVQLLREGGRGQKKSLLLRGTPRARHTLVLVDGVRWSDSTSGSAQLEHLSMDQIDRIEVVRGPASARYGSDAMGGVVQIFTRNPDEREASVTVNAGSFGHFGGQVSASQPLGDRTTLSGGIAYEQQEGYDVQQDNDQPDDDGFEMTSANLSIDRQISDIWSAQVSGRLNRGTSEFDSSFGGDQSDFDRYRLASSATRDSGANQTRLSGFYDYNNSVTYGNGTAKEDADKYVTEQYGGGVDTRQSLTQWLDASVGGEVRREDVGTSTKEYEVTQRNTVSAYGGVEVFGDSWHLDAVVRGTRDDQFGSAFTYSVGGKQFLTDSLTAHVSVGTAYAVPTFNDLYFPNTVSSDPNLKPERSITYEAGAGVDYSFASASLTGFLSQYTDRIYLDSSNGYAIEQGNKAEIIGVEASGSARLWSGAMISGGIDWYWSEDEDGEKLPDVADYSLTASLDQNWQSWTFGLDTLAEGARGEGTDDAREPYQTVDARVSFSPVESLRMGAKAGNLSDADYETEDGYATPGRNYRVELEYSL